MFSNIPAAVIPDVRDAANIKITESCMVANGYDIIERRNLSNVA